MTFSEALEEFLAARDAYLKAYEDNAPVVHLQEALASKATQLDAVLDFAAQRAGRR